MVNPPPPSLLLPVTELKRPRLSPFTFAGMASEGNTVRKGEALSRQREPRTQYSVYPLAAVPRHPHSSRGRQLDVVQSKFSGGRQQFRVSGRREC